MQYWAASGNVEGLQQLLGVGNIEIDRADRAGSTALMYAAEKGHEGCVRLLVEHKADVNHRDKFGETVLMHAVKAGKKPACTWLLELKADITVRDKSFGYSALAHAASKGKHHILKLLLESHDAKPTKVCFEAAEDSGDDVAYGILREHLKRIQGRPPPADPVPPPPPL